MRYSNFIAFADTRRPGSLAWDLETNILTPGWGRRKTALMKQLDELFQDLSPSQLSFPGFLLLLSQWLCAYEADTD